MNKFIGKLKLRNKIASIIVVTALPILVTVFILLMMLSYRVSQNIKNSVETASVSAKNTFEFYKNQSFIYAKLFAEDLDVQRGTYSNNNSLLKKALPVGEEKLAELGLDLVTVYNIGQDKNTVLLQSHFPKWYFNYDSYNKQVDMAKKRIPTFEIVPYYGLLKEIAQQNGYYLLVDESNPLSWDLIPLIDKEPMLWEEAETVMSEEDINKLRDNAQKVKEELENKQDSIRTVMISTLPIFHQSEDMVIGAITVGYRLDTRFLRDLRDLSGVNMLLASGNRIIASSFGLPKSDNKLNIDTRKKIVDINSTEYDLSCLNINNDVYDSLKLVVAIDNEDMKTTLYTLITTLSIVSFFVVLLAIILALVIASNITKSTNEILKGTKEIAKRNFNVKIDLKTEDEFKELSKTFNNMAEEIKVYSERLEGLVAERTEKLKKANEELRIINSRMFRELQMAERVQKSIIPSSKDFPDRKEIGFGSKYSAMENIGGDLYDVIKIEDNVYGCMIADVSGHGVPAALITSMVKVFFTSHSNKETGTKDICKNVNDDMFKLIGDLQDYVTAYYGKLNLETSEFEYTNAGHHPALLIRKKDNKIEKLDTEGFFIGALDQNTYESNKVKLEPGDRILMFTDGIIEAQNPEGEMYEYDRLLDYIQKNSHLKPKEFVDGLVENVDKFCKDEPPHDDRAILFIEFVLPSSPDKSFQDSIHIETREETFGEISDFKEMLREALYHIKTKEYDKALELLVGIEKEYPNNLKILNNLGIVYYHLDKYKEAYDTFKKAIELDNENTVLKKNLDKVKKKF